MGFGNVFGLILLKKRVLTTKFGFWLLNWVSVARFGVQPPAWVLVTKLGFRPSLENKFAGGTPHTLNHTAPSPLFPQTGLGGTQA